MLSKFFGKKEQNQRQLLTHPKDLQLGDMLQFSESFALPEVLRGQTFAVTGINSYQFVDVINTEFQLNGPMELPIFLTVGNDDGQEYLAISHKLTRHEVEDIFDLEAFAEVFDGDGYAELQCLTSAEPYQAWLDAPYLQSAFEEEAYFYRQDFRGTAVPEVADDGISEELRYYQLSSSNQDHLVEIEVWNGGETDVCLTLIRPIDDIVSLLPKGA